MLKGAKARIWKRQDMRLRALSLILMCVEKTLYYFNLCMKAAKDIFYSKLFLINSTHWTHTVLKANILLIKLANSTTENCHQAFFSVQNISESMWDEWNPQTYGWILFSHVQRYLMTPCKSEWNFRNFGFGFYCSTLPRECKYPSVSLSHVVC